MLNHGIAADCLTDHLFYSSESFKLAFALYFFRRWASRDGEPAWQRLLDVRPGKLGTSASEQALYASAFLVPAMVSVQPRDTSSPQCAAESRARSASCIWSTTYCTS